MQATINVSEVLSVRSCPTCFIRYAIPQELQDRRLRYGGDWCCPNGHVLHFTETEMDKAKKELKRTQEELIAARNRLSLELDQHAATRRDLEEKKKESRRVKNGVCPCCKRSFCNLQRHMKTKHPNYAN